MDESHLERDKPILISLMETFRSLKWSNLKDGRFLYFLGDVLLAFIFWSMFSEFIPTMWYIPMNLMAISGIEPILFFPAVCVIFVEPLKIRPKYHPHTYALGLLGLLSFFVDDLIYSGIVQCIGYGFMSLAVFTNLANDDKRQRVATIYSLLIGLLAFVGVRFGLCSINPVFYYSSVNLGLFFAALLILYTKMRFSVLKNNPPLIKPIESKEHHNNIKLGVGLGCFLLLNMVFLTEHGVLSRWVDAHPFPLGIGMMLSMALGIMIAHYNFVKSFPWLGFGILSYLVLIYGPLKVSGWAGLGLIVFLSSIWVVVGETLFYATNLGVVLFISTIVNVLGCIALVWTVAYSFVPILGEELREQTGFVCLAALFGTRLVISRGTKISLPSTQARTAIMFVLFFLVAPSIFYRGMHYGNFDSHGLDKSNVRGMIWAIHFAYDNFGRPSYNGMLEAIKNTTANVIGIIETDLMRVFNGNRDVVEWFEKELHMYSDYGPGTMNHTWGCALLSAFPITRADHYNLPSPEGEIACLIDAELDVNGKPVDVIVTHFGNTQHVLDRKLQTEANVEIINSKEKDRPFVWLGYFTAKPFSENYKRIMSTGIKDTTTDRKRYCEYIWYKNFEMEEFKRIDVGDLSDTEIQYVEFKPLE